MALLAKMAGIGHVAATSVDYPGSLLDVRHQRPEGLHEVEAALDLARAAGAGLPEGDDGRLAVRRPLPDNPLTAEQLSARRRGEGPGGHPLRADSSVVTGGAPLVQEQLSARRRGEGPGGHPLRADSSVVTGGAPLVEEQLSARRRGGYVVLHPGASVPARAIAPEHARAIAEALVGAGWDVVVTGGPRETPLPARPGVHDLTGRTDLPQLAAVLDGAACVVVGNTGPAHLAAAVGTPVVSLFSPVVPAERWAPYGVPTIVLGDQLAACAGTRARECPVPGHPCLTGIRPQQVVDAVASLVPQEVMA
ncbi:glycosyltransferase family 9 protein [Actinomycetaceae bacterium Sa1BUA1]|uniref:Glycosyltransferase family 9 protein n=2 Tax=Oceanitalea stevensii TaxID=2763072 RepID=A0ABR8Z169_9MICO|nr:glycosyltransferase family 9 protein [Oceanitalea stevensii]